MGKKNKRKHNHHQHGGHQHKNKRRKKGRGHWANNCHDSKPKQGSALITVVVSQCDLVDDHQSCGQGTDGKLEPAMDAPTVEPTNDTKAANGNELEAKDEEDEMPEDRGPVPATHPSTPVGEIGSKDAKDESESMTADKKPENEGSEKNPLKDEPLSAKDGIDKGEDATAVKEPGVATNVVDDASRNAGRGFIAVKRLPSATGPQKVYKHPDFQHLPNGDCGDGIVNPFPKDQVADKYWAQRRRLFTKFDEGVELDKEGWFSVTPEAIANHIAKRIVPSSSNAGGMVILDAFCGCGGNAIAFARRPEVSLVVCVDTDMSRLEMAAKNASIYGIEKTKLLFMHDNAIRILSRYSNGKLNAEASPAHGIEGDDKLAKLHGYTCNDALPDRLDCIFLSPPWGGTEYEQKGSFTVKNHICIKDAKLNTLNGEELLTFAFKAAKRCVYFLPRNLNGISMGWSAANAGYTGSFELEKNMLNGKFKTITCYLGFHEEEAR